MASLKLDYVQPEDIPAIDVVDRDAFYRNEHPYIEAMHPDSDTPRGMEVKMRQSRERLSALLPNEHWFKVTDTQTGEIMLTGTWYSPFESSKSLQKFSKDPIISGPYWANEDDLAWAQHLSVRYTQRRRDAFVNSKGQLFAVKHLGVDPKAQGKGAGALFMKWGTEQADRRGLECVVEASIRAEGYYKKWGFESKEHVKFEIPEGEERWRGKGVQEYIWMIRKPQSGLQEPAISASDS